MSEEVSAAPAVETAIDGDVPIVNDAITSEETGYVSDAGTQAIEEVASGPSEEGQTEVQAETKEEFQEELSDAIEEGATEEEVQNMIKEFELKVNGRTVKKKIDLSDEEEIKRQLQLALAGQDSMQENSQIKKNLKEEIEFLQKNPWAGLEGLGFTKEQLDILAEERLRAQVEEMKKSPEQLEREKMQKELAEAREQLEAERKAREEAVFQQLQEQQSVQLENEIMDALDSHQTLPKSQKTVSRIADAMLWAIEEGYSDVTVNDVLPSVEAEIERELQGFMSELPEELLEKYIGKKNLERLKNKKLEQLRKVPNQHKVAETAKSLKKEEEDTKTKRKKARDYFRNL